VDQPPRSSFQSFIDNRVITNMRPILRFIRADRFARDEKGGTLAELAILVPFLVVMLAAVSELGRLFQTYTTLSKSTRAAARYLSNHPYDDSPVDYITNAKNMAVCGMTDCTGKEPVAPRLTTANITVTPEWPEGAVGNPTTVTISVSNYNFQPLFNLNALLPVDRFTALPVTSSTTMYYMWTDPAGAEE
jgi:Flp pilus assembly protein TadG